MEPKNQVNGETSQLENASQANSCGGGGGEISNSSSARKNKKRTAADAGIAISAPESGCVRYKTESNNSNNNNNNNNNSNGVLDNFQAALDLKNKTISHWDVTNGADEHSVGVTTDLHRREAEQRTVQRQKHESGDETSSQSENDVAPPGDSATRKGEVQATPQEKVPQDAPVPPNESEQQSDADGEGDGEGDDEGDDEDEYYDDEYYYCQESSQKSDKSGAADAHKESSQHGFAASVQRANQNQTAFDSVQKQQQQQQKYSRISPYTLNILKKQYIALDNSKLIASVGIADDNILEWNVCFEGPEKTLYQGGIFQTKLLFPTDYPNSPPVMRFITPMWHPNIFPDGRVCISILHAPGRDQFNDQELESEKWRPILTAEDILISVISMLQDPNIESPANIDASKQYRDDREAYNNRVRDLAKRSTQM